MDTGDPLFLGSYIDGLETVLAYLFGNFSHLMGSLAEVFCGEIVAKSLPNCEHTAQILCSQDVALHRCSAPCGGLMTSCCGRDCNSSCFDCQQVNERAAEGPVVRQMHRQHPCQKALYCEHLCQNPCSQDHQCTTKCEKACRQICSHARCRKHCSVPCAPCQSSCTWCVQSFYYFADVPLT